MVMFQLQIKFVNNCNNRILEIYFKLEVNIGLKWGYILNKPHYIRQNAKELIAKYI